MWPQKSTNNNNTNIIITIIIIIITTFIIITTTLIIRNLTTLCDQIPMYFTVSWTEERLVIDQVKRRKFKLEIKRNNLLLIR